jgi:hypothetical protein
MKYSRQRQTAQRLIDKAGQEIQIETISSDGNWNNPEGSSVPFQTVGVFFPITKEKHESIMLKGHDLSGSVYVMVPPFGGIASPGDYVIRSGEKLIVDYADVFSVNGEVIFHEIYLKGDVSASITVL